MTTYSIASGQLLSGLALGSGDMMTVLLGGTTSDATVEFGGVMVLASGATAYDVEVSSGAKLIVSSGAMVSAVTLHSGASYYANNSWTVASMERHISGGIYEVGSGETVSGVTLDEFATMRVSSGGTALDVDVIKGGALSVESGAVVSGIFNGGGGAICVASGGTAYIESSVAANWLQANERCVSSASGAIVSYTEAQDGIIYRRGRMNNGRSYLEKTGLTYLENMVVGGDDVYAASGTNLDQYLLLSGCSARDVTVTGGGAYGAIYVCNGASMEHITIGSVVSGCGIEVFAGGSATDVIGTTRNAIISVMGGHLSGFTGIGMVSVDSRHANFQSNTLLPHSTYAVGGVGVLEDARFTSGALVSACSSGILSNWSAESGVRVHAWEGGALCDGILSGGEMVLSSGGIAENTIVSSGSLVVSSGASAEDVMLYDGAKMWVSSGASVADVNLCGGSLVVQSGAVVSELYAGSGTILVSSGGTAIIQKGINGWMWGLTASHGITLSSASGAVISQVDPRDGVIYQRVNGSKLLCTDVSVISGGMLTQGDYVVLSGCTICEESVDGNADVLVCSGGVASRLSTGSGAVIQALAGGSVMDISGNGFIRTFGGCVSGVTLSSGGTCLVIGGDSLQKSLTENLSSSYHIGGAGSAADVTIYSGASMTVNSGAMASDVAVVGGMMTMSSGASADDISLGSGSLVVQSGAVVTDILRGGGTLVVSSGGTAFVQSAPLITWNSGIISSASGAVISYTDCQDGVIYTSRQVDGAGAVFNTGSSVISGGTVGSGAYALQSGCSVV